MIALVSIFLKWPTWIREIIQFLLAVRKHNFLRTSPAEARNALIRMPAEMKRDGASVKTLEELQDKYRCPGICSPSNTQANRHMRGNKAQSEWTVPCTQAPHRIYTASFTVRSGVSGCAGPILNRIHETHQAECYLPLSEYCIQLICDIWISH